MRNLCLLMLLAAVACKSAPETLPQQPDEVADAHQHVDALRPDLDGWAPEFRDVSLQIVEPRAGAVYESGDVSVVLNLQNYTLGDKGPHIHLILDNQPYIAHYDATKPYDFKGLAPGAHLLRAFPSRPWHESIKASPRAFAMVRFVVGEDDGKFSVDETKPIFTFSRPKGEYEGDAAKRILFDFYLRNVELATDGDRVRYVLDGAEHFVSAWQPIWWENLAPGEHTLSAGLVDAAGQPVENGGINQADRTFVVK